MSFVMSVTPARLISFCAALMKGARAHYISCNCIKGYMDETRDYYYYDFTKASLSVRKEFFFY